MCVVFKEHRHGLREDQHQVVRLMGGGIRVRGEGEVVVVLILQEELRSLSTSPLPAKV
jgi:hypothetical protein